MGRIFKCGWFVVGLVVAMSFFGSSTGADLLPYAGLHLVFDDEFSGQTLSSQWTVAPVESDNLAIGTYNPKLVTQNNVLRVGAVESLRQDSQVWTSHGFLYGVFEIKARCQVGSGAGCAIWLFPANNTWPPEIDISEIPGGTRTVADSSVHFTSQNLQYSAQVQANFSQWNTWDLRWTKTSIQILLNGKLLNWYYNQVLTGANAVSSYAIPHIPMKLDLGMQVGFGDDWYPGADSPPYHHPANIGMQVAYVRIYQ